jgi:lipoprotein-anchoring transpeptidase ErfK/SrfK
MNSVKTIVVIGILLGVGYWVYNSIHNKRTGPLPEELAEGWPGEVNVEMPGDPSALPPPSFGVNPPFDSETSGVQTPITAQPPAAGGALVPPAAPPPAGMTASDGFPAQPYGVGPSPTPVFPAQEQAGVDPTAPTRPDAIAVAPEPPAESIDTLSPAPPVPADGEVQTIFEEFMQAVQRDLDGGRFREAHRALSRWHADSRLSEEHRRRILGLLDQVAGLVVYSREHHLAEPHVVKPGETPETIAASYDVPWELLAKVNGIPEAASLTPGQVLKVVRGPFRAIIDLDDHELTLMLDDLYAGRFPIRVGQDEPQLEGNFEVRSKMHDPAYQGPAGTFHARDPNNPFGDRKLDLDGRIAIHGTNAPQDVGKSGGPGTISLRQEDVAHVYDILSVGSRVVIRR